LNEWPSPTATGSVGYGGNGQQDRSHCVGRDDKAPGQKTSCKEGGVNTSFMGDGAYDRAHVLDAVLARNPAVRFIVPPCKGAVLGSTATNAPTQRDSHISSINEHGRMNWQKTSGYNRRSKVEAAIGRYKHIPFT